MNPEYTIILRDSRSKINVNGNVIFEIAGNDNLPEVSEIYLKKDQVLTLPNHTGYNLLVPVHGEITVAGAEDVQTIFPSEYASIKAGKTVSVNGNRDEELSRFYLFEIREVLNSDFTGNYAAAIKNELQLLVKNSIQLHIGIFDGRNESEYLMTKQNALVICVNGAFEFQNRLIETCDSLLIKNDTVLEMEALSENAVILILEF